MDATRCPILLCPKICYWYIRSLGRLYIKPYGKHLPFQKKKKKKKLAYFLVHTFLVWWTWCHQYSGPMRCSPGWRINIVDYFNGLQKVQTVKSAQTVKENQTNDIALGQSTPEYNLLLILFWWVLKGVKSLFSINCLCREKGKGQILLFQSLHHWLLSVQRGVRVTSGTRWLPI